MARQANSRPDSGAAPQGNGNVTPPAGEAARAAGNETQTPGSGAKPEDSQPKPGSGAPQGNGNADGKKTIRNPGKAGKKLFVGSRLIQFDADGSAELDEAEAAVLLGLKSGYEEA
jgi:hypothetical protein